jgi:F0F1-type ATP synthase assembly protein I
MAKIGVTLGKKAAKATAKHTVKGVAAKAERRPFRSLTLLVLGGLIGAAVGWTVARKSATEPAPASS